LEGLHKDLNRVQLEEDEITPLEILNINQEKEEVE
jgi:hypothetical protein